jgi:hypothetical protein
MKKLASTLLVTATLVGTVGAACAQYGGGYYGPGPYYGVVITTMAGTTGENMVMAEPSSDTTDSAGNN